ncbi:hypothetical protein KQX54_000082 [Cotesia glomerata]|uniref:Ig-like domain-containing protein n=1 Tax=Cotesia glomerata TaxID=32391 RepID=A0AAV7HTK8_COTGL|nr:hypothetical protein KQX54_000082 [Cotesia glomerata]
MRTRTVCGVAAGDQPLTISWLKDGHSPFQLSSKSLSDTSISQLDSYSSLLSLSNLAAEHSGDYTCVAANPAAEVRYTAKLQMFTDFIIFIFLTLFAVASSWILEDEAVINL